MKVSLAILSAVLGLSTAKKARSANLSALKKAPSANLSATSKVGQKVLSKARLLENDDNAEVDYTWVANMALKFQGCYHSQQWNEEADGDEDVKISTKRLVRFRLCPADSCSMESAAGCTEGYGDYIIDMETYLQAYLEAVQQDQEYNCEYEKDYGDCNCENADDEEICEYDCYMGKGMEYCVDNNPYADDEEEEEEKWELEEMAECREYDFEQNDDGNNNNGDDGEEIEYFVGAYCSDDGGSIHLGLFTDETCSNFADDYGGRETFASLSYGKSLPYSESTIVGSECMSCKEVEDGDNDNDQQDEDEVKESCETLYQMSGKCEAGLGVDYPNNYACNFMQGIKVIHKSGATVQGDGSKNKTASAFVGLFACSFVLLGGYVYYLKTKLDRAKINLSE